MDNKSPALKSLQIQTYTTQHPTIYRNFPPHSTKSHALTLQKCSSLQMSKTYLILTSSLSKSTPFLSFLSFLSLHWNLSFQVFTKKTSSHPFFITSTPPQLTSMPSLSQTTPPSSLSQTLSTSSQLSKTSLTGPRKENKTSIFTCSSHKIQSTFSVIGMYNVNDGLPFTKWRIWKQLILDKIRKYIYIIPPVLFYLSNFIFDIYPHLDSYWIV